MSEWSMPFIGRTHELDTIQRHLQAWGTSHLIFISGEGGIGKTRLLNQVEEQFTTSILDVPIKVLPIIDFDERRFALPRSIGFRIAHQLNQESAFVPYMDILNDLQLHEEQDNEIRSPYIQRKLQESYRTFKECFNRVARSHRIVLRFDTTEKEARVPLDYLLVDLFPDLENTLFLVAGRTTHEFYTTYQSQLTGRATLLPLDPFNSEEWQLYLENKQQAIKRTLDREWMNLHFHLAGGIPVLVDLAIERTQAGHSWIVPLSQERFDTLAQRIKEGDHEASKEMGAWRETFKCELVRPFTDLSSLFNHLLMVLAIVYPLDMEGIRELLDLTQDEAEQLRKKALGSVAIKPLPNGFIKLHDEIQRLIAQYNWPLVDPEHRRERRDNVRAIRYLNRVAKALGEQVIETRTKFYQGDKATDPAIRLNDLAAWREAEGRLWAIRFDRLERQLVVDVQKGYELFEQEWQQAQEVASATIYREGFLAIIKPFADLTDPAHDLNGGTLTETQQLDIATRLAREATFNGRYKEAAQLYEALRQRVPEQSERYIEVLYGQSNQLIRTGKLTFALRVSEQALQAANHLGSAHWETKTKTGIGWIHRLSWNLERALQYYNDAYKSALRQDDEAGCALIAQSRAYVRALRQDPAALEEIQQAIRAWKRLAPQREVFAFDLARCYNTAGEVCLELGLPNEALNHFGTAFDIFYRTESHEGKEWKSKCRAGRGFAHWYLAQQPSSQPASQPNTPHLLKEALDDLKWAADHATPFDRPSTLNRLGEVYFSQQAYHDAETSWRLSQQEASAINDAFVELQSMGNLVRLALYHPIAEYPSWQAFENWYKGEYRQRYQSAFGFQASLVSLFYVYLGNLALKEGQLPHALRFYKQGLPMLAANSRPAPFNLSSQLRHIEEALLPQVPTEVVRELGENLKQDWLEGNRSDLTALSFFQEWIRHAKTSQQDTEVRNNA